MNWDGIHEFDRILPDVPFKRYELEIPGEYWVQVPYDNIKTLYISNYARVKNGKFKIIAPYFKKEVNRKYMRIVFTSGKQTSIPLDRLMVFTFMGREESCIIHIDGDTSNNDLINLTF